jgi:hypothetical protein
VARTGWRDLDVKPGTYAITVAAGPANASYDLIVKPRTFRRGA